MKREIFVQNATRNIKRKNERLVLRKREKIMDNDEKYKDCLSCSNSHSDECDILHCMERNGQVVEEDGYCKEWN